MATNPYVNKVQLADGTSLIDISDTTATADKILQGYTAYGADGQKLTGTATGGGGSVTQDQDGFIVLPPDGGGSPIVGGLEYETGTYQPSVDDNNPTINFTGTHDKPPMFLMISDVTGTYDATENTHQFFGYMDWYRLTGEGFNPSTTATSYAQRVSIYRGTNASSITTNDTSFSFNSDTTGSSSTYPLYWVTESWFKPSANSTSRYWRAGRTYKWIAVWAPTT